MGAKVADETKKAEVKSVPKKLFTEVMNINEIYAKLK